MPKINCGVRHGCAIQARRAKAAGAAWRPSEGRELLVYYRGELQPFVFGLEAGLGRGGGAGGREGGGTGDFAEQLAAFIATPSAERAALPTALRAPLPPTPVESVVARLRDARAFVANPPALLQSHPNNPHFLTPTILIF